MTHIRPKNWGDFQHYKDRDPPWIKLHKKLLDNFQFHRLPVDSRALAPMLWLLASEDKNGLIVADPQEIGFRLRMSAEQVEAALNPLIQANFFEVVQVDSDALAEVVRDATPETEAETQEQTQKQTDGFADFWKAFPKQTSEQGAWKAYRLAITIAPPAIILAGARRYAAAVKRDKTEPKFVKGPAAWLADRRWTDGGGSGPPAESAFNSPEEREAQRRLMEKHYAQA